MLIKEYWITARQKINYYQVDVIIKIDEKPIRTLEEFSEIIRSYSSNQIVRVIF